MAKDLTGQVLYIDCFSGIAGDMFLGAMIDLGVPADCIRSAIAAVGVSPSVLTVGRTSHHGLLGCDVKVRGDRKGARGSHRHEAYSHIRDHIARSKLAPAIARRALDIFERLAGAEAKVHGMTIEDVVFHELGALDALVDVVGAAAALEYLAPSRVVSRVVPVGSGMVRGAHGQLPVPAPATLELLRGVPIEQGPVAAEISTPTGAAILCSCVNDFDALPRGELLAVGYGAGDQSFDSCPNHLRLMLFAPAKETRVGRVALLETCVDDMSPEWCSHLSEIVLAGGALDMWFTPVVMKKGRPGFQISVLVDAGKVPEVRDLLFSETTTLGIRISIVERQTLERTFTRVTTAYGPIRIKQGYRAGELVNAAPEFEECRRAALARRVPLKEVYAAAMAAHRLKREELDLRKGSRQSKKSAKSGAKGRAQGVRRGLAAKKALTKARGA